MLAAYIHVPVNKIEDPGLIYLVYHVTVLKTLQEENMKEGLGKLLVHVYYYSRLLVNGLSTT